MIEVRSKLTQRHLGQRASSYNKGIKIKAAWRRREIEGLMLKKQGKVARKWTRDSVTGGRILGAEMDGGNEGGEKCHRRNSPKAGWIGRQSTDKKEDDLLSPGSMGPNI